MHASQSAPATIKTMSSRERASTRGSDRGRGLIVAVGREIRLARRGLGLSLRTVAREIGISPIELSRIERGLAPWVSVITLARACAVVGLDLSVKTYPGARPVREVRHVRLLARLRRLLHPSLLWATEVPLPNVGDQRSIDAVIRGPGWRYGVEAELNPVDGQALLRRLRLKLRDSGIDGLILLLPDTRQARRFRAEYAELLASDYPGRSSATLHALAQGECPTGSTVIVVR
jgi:transcriptional regulator with XRE-family HTH domain